MFSALLYLQFVSFRNRLVLRVKRLKQPKYLIGAVAGGLYFYFYFFRWMFGTHRHGAGPGPMYEMDPALSLSLWSLILLIIVLLAWVVPRKRAALTFTEAEVAFLFPAPVTRRTLIHYKLLRSQFSIFLMTLFFTFLFRKSGGHLWIRAVGGWVILMTLNLHFIGASFAITMLLDRGISTWKRRLGILGLVLGVGGAVAVWAVRALPPLTSANLADFDTLTDYARQVLISGPLPYILSPFQLMVRPYQAAEGIAFLKALWPAVIFMAVHYWWVVRSDVAFEEASMEASQKIADRVAHIRSGKSVYTAGKEMKGRRAPFTLSSTGAQPVALLWKNLLSAGQGFSNRTWVTLIVAVLVMVFVFRSSAGASSEWPQLVGSLAAMLGAWAILIGPQVVRQDLRQDIPLADLLKLYPMRGWQVVLGEILAPAVILTGIHWLLLLLAVGLLYRTDLGNLPHGMVIAIGLGAAVVLPMLNLISLLIPNAAVLLFPGWFRTGKDSPQGIEATGQRLIFALGQFLAFAVSLLPAGVAFAAVFFLVQMLAGEVIAVPVASVAAAVVLAVEAGLGMMWLGWLFERFDVTSES